MRCDGVPNYLKEFENNKKEPIYRIKYECRSACTTKLALPNVCVTPQSSFKFHGAWNVRTGKIVPKANEILMSYYRLRPAVAQWVIDHHALESRAYVVMTGSQAIALGVPQCP